MHANKDELVGLEGERNGHCPVATKMVISESFYYGL